MPKLLTTALAAAVVGSIAFAPLARAEASAEQRAAAKAKWDAMTPEQREAAKTKAKARWESMTPEEQAAAKKRFAEKHPAAAARMAGQQHPAASAPAAK
jgi:hypothetical protein